MKPWRMLFLLAIILLSACGTFELSVEQPTATSLPPQPTQTSGITPVTVTQPPPPLPSPTQSSDPPSPTDLPPSAVPVTDTPSGPQMVKIFLIAVGDNGVSGDLIGCGDSAVPVQVEITPTQGVLKAALQALLAIKTRDYGQSGLYNALYQSNLQLDSVKIENGTASIYLSGSLMLGGECDNPRVEAQLMQTARQFSTVKTVSISARSLACNSRSCFINSSILPRWLADA